MFVISGRCCGMFGSGQNSHVALGWCGALSSPRALVFDISSVGVAMDCTGLASCDRY
jgi:hypothetical protein